METNDSNVKPHQTSGLKLMTVFIVVLAAHVVVIGGFTVYHLMNGGNSESELADKTHKNVKLASDGDGNLPAGQADTTTTTPSTENTSTAANTPASAPEQAPATENSNPPAPATPTMTVVNTVTPPLGPVHAGAVLETTPVAPVPETAETASAFEPAPGSGTPYVVKSHDSLAKIAHQNHTTVAKLKSANGLNTDMLHIGQKLVIPAKMQVAAAPASTENPDSTGSTTILGNSATTPSMNIPASTAPAPTVVHNPAATTAAAPATNGHHLYTVVKGDTLTKIAHKFKTTPTAIMTANNITDPAKLSIGKKLKIPSQEARSATNAAEPAATQPIQQKTGPTGQLANFVQ